MPRTARILLPNTPHHIYQQGHNRENVFFEANDYQYYINNMLECKALFDIKIYAYCILQNKIHLIIKPKNNAEHVSLFMKRVAGRQSRYTNARYNRSGSIWDGRFKSTPINEMDELYAYCHFIEGLPNSLDISSKSLYPWSSLAYRSGVRKKDIVDDLPRLKTATNKIISIKDKYKKTLQDDFHNYEQHLLMNTD